SAKGMWLKSLKATQNRIERLSQVVRTVAAWNWPDETEEALWTVVNRFPAEKWAFQALYSMFYTSGKTRSLQNLLTRVTEVDPTNSVVKNNLAMTTLLINPKDRRSRDIAHEAYREHPDNPFILSTYAYTLHLQDKTQEALKLFATLKPEQLQNPAI